MTEKRKKYLDELTNADRSKRLGERKQMRCGIWATIIRYGKHNDIDVEFDDGEIATKKNYYNFTVGAIAHPKYSYRESFNELVCIFYFKQLGFQKSKQGDLKHLGFETKELDMYNPNFYGKRIAIEYDGYADPSKERGHILEKDLLKNELCQANDIILYRIREPQLPIMHDTTSINFILDNCKQASESLENILKTIVNDLKLKVGELFELDINFERDLSLIQKFVRDNNGFGYYLNRIGEKNIMNCGLEAEIIEYYSSKNMTVRFLIDGAIVKNVLYKTFTNGNIKHPKYGCKYRIGEEKTMNCGLVGTITEYFNCCNCTVKLSDGSVVSNIPYSKFKDGAVRPLSTEPRAQRENKLKHREKQQTNVKTKTPEIKQPKIKQSKSDKPKHYDERINQTLTMHCGLTATIIEYFNSDNCTVRFSDGVVIYKVKYQRFANSSVGHPTIKTKLTITKSRVISRVGLSKIMNCGMSATIIGYRNNKDIDVQFADGTIVQHRSMTDFNRGEIKNPHIKKNTYASLCKKSAIND